MEMYRILAVSCTIIFYGVANASCVIQDLSGAKTTDEKKIIKLAGWGWLSHAKVCSAGGYKIAVPARQRNKGNKDMLLFFDGKPVMWRSNGETIMYNPNPKHADLGHPILDLWNSKDGKDIQRLWYQTVPDKYGQYVTTYDMNYDGQPDVRTVTRKSKIIRSFILYKNTWYLLHNRCITIAKECYHVKFVKGKWRLQESKQNNH